MSYPLSIVPFHGDGISTVAAGDSQYVVLRPIVEALGLSWGAQTKKISDDNRFNCFDIETVGLDGKTREMLCIPLRKLNGWLFSINPNKVREDLREKVITYQEECFQVLHDYWQGKTVRRQLPHDPDTNPFTQINTKTLAALQKQDKVLAWQYLESLGIEKPAGLVSTSPSFEIDVADLVKKLRAVAQDYDQEFFFVEVGDMMAITRHHRRKFIDWLLDEGYLLPGELTEGRIRKARKLSKKISDDMRRVYVISRELFDLLEVSHAS